MRWIFALIVLIPAVPAWADTSVVLPFFNVSKDHNLDWIGESLAETVRESLASGNIMTLDRDGRLAAYGRLGVRPYALLTKATVIKIGEALDAGHVVYGQFEVRPAAGAAASKSRGSLQVVAHILDLKHMQPGPDFQEVGALEDLAALENHLAWRTLQLLDPAAAPSEEAFRRRRPPVRLDAIENYVRGLLASNPDEQHRLFTQALRLDPRYTQPCFELGRLDWKKKDYRSAAEWFLKVPAAQPNAREASFFLGLCRYYLGDFANAASAFQSVARAVPLNEVYNNLGAAESRRNLPQALENFRKALEGDSSDPDYQFNVGYALWKQGSFQAAAERFRSVLERDPADANAGMLLARCVKQSGPRPSDTRTEGLERLKTNYEESAYWQLRDVLQAQKP